MRPDGAGYAQTVDAVLVATWSAGLFVISGGRSRQEMAGHAMRGLAPDGRGGALAIVDGRSLCRRTADGIWSTIATAAADLACCVAAGNAIYVGTDDASVLRVSADGEIELLPGFAEVEGRGQWYAGGAWIGGEFRGPPLGVRSMAASTDGAVLLANVHVGGIPRSVDRGARWQPTIEIGNDVHEVRIHPNHPDIAAAAAAAGLCISRDGGLNWEVEAQGLHARHCSAVAFAGRDILVSASVDPFAPEGAVYRRGVDEDGALVPVTGGLPQWLGGSPDTGCIATSGAAAAMADRKGNLYISADYGRTWSHGGEGFPMPSGVLIL
jgi:hypothetical protein